jgi:hypothetical protein
MKRFLIALLFLLCVSPVFATTADVVATDCKAYIAGQDNGKTTYDNFEQGIQANRCLGYIAGFVDESTYELFFVDEAHVKTAKGQWQQNTKVDQVIRVFVKYVQANPETLNKEAVDILRLSAVKAGIYIYVTVPVQPVDN